MKLKICFTQYTVVIKHYTILKVVLRNSYSSLAAYTFFYSLTILEVH
ncbi:hypothetical protein EMIT0180MI3_30239 [Priestia megaterium]